MTVDISDAEILCFVQGMRAQGRWGKLVIQYQEGKVIRISREETFTSRDLPEKAKSGIR